VNAITHHSKLVTVLQKLLILKISFLFFAVFENTYFTFFSDFKKHDFTFFFEMMYQKVVKSVSKSFVLNPSK